MPTYAYRCPVCDHVEDVVQSISSYCTDPRVPTCAEHPEVIMQRSFSVNTEFSGLANALAGDRHYDGMQASDGTDISTRTKHREYMKRTGLTTASDYTETWKAQESVRQSVREGTYRDKDLRETIARSFYQKFNGG